MEHSLKFDSLSSKSILNYYRFSCLRLWNKYEQLVCSDKCNVLVYKVMSFGRTSQTFGRNTLLPFTALDSQPNRQNVEQLLSGYLLGLVFTPEDRGSKFFRIASKLPDFVMFYLRRQYYCYGSENLTAYKCRLIHRNFKKGCLNNLGWPMNIRALVHFLPPFD
jgi:hypothetical protein